MNYSLIVLSVIIMGLITFATRVLPFVLFRNHQPGKRFLSLQKRLPALMLVILLFWAVKDFIVLKIPADLITLGCLLMAGFFQALWKNALISIFVPTILFMVLKALIAA